MQVDVRNRSIRDRVEPAAIRAISAIPPPKAEAISLRRRSY